MCEKGLDPPGLKNRHLQVEGGKRTLNILVEKGSHRTAKEVESLTREKLPSLFFKEKEENKLHKSQQEPRQEEQRSGGHT